MQTEAEIEAEVAQLVSRGQWFFAYDVARPAIERFPGNLRLRQDAARALLKVKAVEDARRILEPLCKPYDSHNPQLRQLYQRVREATRYTDNPNAEPSPDAMRALSDLIDAAAQTRQAFTGMRATDVETIGLLARAYKDAWRESGSTQDAKESRDTYLRAFENTGSVWMGINAATMSAALAHAWAKVNNEPEQDKESELSRKLAWRALEVCDRMLKKAEGDDHFWLPATKGEALLLRDKKEEAIEQYKIAAAWAQALEAREPGGSQRLIVSASEQLRLLLDIGIDVDPVILNMMKPPTVVVFAGHMLDQDDRRPPRFPKSAEIHVREGIDGMLNELDARIGYSSAACGSDLLFIEAMLDRGAEVNILLPFDKDDFVRMSVAHGGERWKRRFERAIKLAGDHVTYATREKFLDTHDLFAFADKMLASMAYLRATNMGSLPYLVAVFDGTSPVKVGGTADVVRRWPDPQRRRVISPLGNGPVDVQAAPPAATGSAQGQDTPAPDAPRGTSRSIRTILFADVVGFSRMNEEQTPAFIYKFLQKLSEELDKLKVQPLMENTWGDAIVAVMEDAFPLVEYARTLQRVIRSTPWKEMGLPENMNARIGLHAGPVFEGDDPITGRRNFFGSHVNRAARIEPVTLPGRIYASQQFIGLLTAELRSRGDEQWPFVCEWLGTMDLAKGFGRLPIYHIRERRTGEPDVVSVARYDQPAK